MNVRDPAHPDWHPWVRPVKKGVLVATALPALWVGAEFASLWLLLAVVAPTAIFAAVIRDVGFVVVVGAGLLLLDMSSYWVAFSGDDWSDSLALLWIPLFGIPFVLVSWFIQALALPPDA